MRETGSIRSNAMGSIQCTDRIYGKARPARQRDVPCQTVSYILYRTIEEEQEQRKSKREKKELVKENGEMVPQSDFLTKDTLFLFSSELFSIYLYILQAILCRTAGEKNMYIGELTC